MLNIALITLGDPNRLTGGYMYHVRLAERAPQHGARIDFVSFPDWRFPLPMLAAPSVMRRAQRADAILLDSIAAAFLAPMWMLRPPSVPVVALLHQTPGGIDHGPLRTRLQAWLDRSAYRHARRLLLDSHALADHPYLRDFPRASMQVASCGRDGAATPSGATPDLRQGRRAALLCVANWQARKDILSLVESVALLPNDVATLHLVGDEDVEPAYAARVLERLERDDLRHRVVRHGKIPREAVAALYLAADAFVLPSLVEPYGTVYAEAMSAGLPVVGWRAGNLPHLATHEREGLLVEAGDLHGLSRALLRLAIDEPLRNQLAEAARTRAQSFPTWDETTRDVIEAVRSTIK